MLEVVIPTQAGTLFWARLTYIFIVTTPVLWLFFILDYLGYADWKKLPWSLTYWIIPCIGLILVFTDGWHHLIWKSYHFLPIGAYLALQVVHGAGFYIIWGFAHLMILGGVVLLLRENLNRSKYPRGQAVWIILGAFFVILFSVIYVSHIIPGLQKDYTSIALAFGGICFGIAILRYRLLTITPIGKDALFAALDDGILILDDGFSIVNINDSGQRLLCVKENEVIGKPIYQVIKSLPPIDSLSDEQMKDRFDVCECETPLTYLNVKISRINDSSGHHRGYLILFRDTTSEKIAQIAERDEHVFAQALSEIAIALNSLHNLDDLLDLIINVVKRVTSCDSANVMMIDGDYAQVVRNLDPIRSKVRLPINTTRNLRMMVENRVPILMPDVNDFSVWVKTPETEWVRSYVGSPIMAFDVVIGFINLDSAIPGFYNQKTAERLFAFAHQASIAIQNARTNKNLEELASTDSLTGLLNRRHFFLLANKEFERAKRYRRALSALMIDLDRFKKINDKHGHLIGDEVLLNVAQACTKEMREVDVIGRYGGEEFSIILPETALLGAKQVANRLCEQIADLEILTAEGVVTVTASLGVAEIDMSCKRLEDLLGYADKALYAAKSKGRNRVEVFQPVDIS